MTKRLTLTNEVLDAIIRRRYCEGKTLSIEKICDEDYNPHYIKDKARDYYGSWTEALIENGVKPNERYSVTKDDVIDELKRLQNDGHSMKTNEFDSWLYRGILTHFGGYGNAKKELGITPDKSKYIVSEKRRAANESKVVWTDEIIRQELTELTFRDLSRTEMRKSNPKLFAAIDRKFNSLDDCGDYYGISFPDKSKNTKYTNEQINDFILKCYKEGKNSSYIKSTGSLYEKRMHNAVLRLYKTWNKALLANGIEPERTKRIFSTRDDVAHTYKGDLEKGVLRGDITYRKSITKYFGSVDNLEKHLGIFEEPDEEIMEVYEKSILDNKIYGIYSKDHAKLSSEILDSYDKAIAYSIRHHYNSITEYFSQLDIDFYAKPYVPFRWDAENTKRQLLRWIREGKPVNYTSVAYRHSGIIEASRKIHGSYEGLFVACGLNYNDYRTDTTLAAFYGKALENVFECILKDLGVTHRTQPSINGCHPDFVVGETWYDAKLSEWTINNPDCETVKKYEPHCEKLVIVFLRGNKEIDRMISDKTRLVNIYKFVEMLPVEKQENYKIKLNEIESKVASNELGSRSNDTKTA